MKKVYVLLLLTAHIVSTLCMEKERYYDNYDYDAPIELEETSILPYQPNSQNYKYPDYIEDPQWPYFNRIMNMPYRKSPTDEDATVLLEPIYNTEIASKKNICSITKKEKKPFLPKLTLTQPKDDLMKQLYADALNCFQAPSLNRALSHLIKNMNNAKANNINEDMMGKFSLNKYWNIANYYEYRIALLFSCVKRHALSVHQTEKAISNKTLTDNLGIVTNFTPQKISPYLENVLRILKKPTNSWAMQNLAACLYQDETILLPSSSKDYYKNLTQDFYELASNVFISGKYIDEIYKLLQMIDQAKKKHDITEEKDLGYTILNYEPSLINKIFKSLTQKPSYSLSDIKNRVTIFCTLIANYNKARGKKITPTNDHYQCCLLKNSINIAFPDSFNNYVFDESIYAFVEFYELMTAASSLMDAESEEVQANVNSVYLERNNV